MNDTMQPFLDDGLIVYSKARATLTFFEEEIGKLLLAAAEQREKWPFLKSHKICQPKSDKGVGQLGYWVAMDIEGASDRNEKVEIDCGVWWNALKNVSPIIYVNFSPESERAVKFSWIKDKQGIKSFDRWNRTFLYLSLLKPADIGDSLNLLLDELLKELK